jgi:hypothetical protein
MWSVLEASRETLQFIRLQFETTKEKSYLHLCEMRFPRLRSLILRMRKFDGFFEREVAPDEFKNFIIAHGDTLEELEMASDEYDSKDAWTFNVSAFSENDSLPRLKKFKGHADAFQKMVETRMNSLQSSLERLDIIPTCEDFTGSDLKRTFDSIIQLLIFNALRELRINFSRFANSPETVTEYIHKAFQFCGSTLEVWLGRMPIPVNVGSLAATSRT